VKAFSFKRSHIVLAGKEYPLGTAEERLAARVALADAGLTFARIEPPDGREFCVDGLTSYEGLIDMSHFERELHELMRKRHSDENAPEFMGYTPIELTWMVRSITEKTARGPDTDEEFFERYVWETRGEAGHSISTEAFERELDSWAAARPERTTLTISQ